MEATTLLSCYWTLGTTCRRTAKKSIAVKRGNVVIWQVVACLPHCVNANREAIDHAQRVGGSWHSVDITVPVRTAARRRMVNVAIPAELHARMVIVAQTSGMSGRQFTARAINNQIGIDELKTREDKGRQGRVMIDNETCPYSDYGHSWEAGMMHVHPEDAASTAVARARFGETVECSQCEHVYVIEQGS